MDFVCIDKRIIIEVDGGQHTEEKDKIRNEWLKGQGYKVIHFWDNEVLTNIEGVLEFILSQMPSP